MVKLTDQELNEWVASKLLEWKCFKKDKSGIKYYYNKENPRLPWYIGPDLECVLPRFNPCHDLNHANLMEKKIRDFSEIKRRDYCCNLFNLIEKPENDDMLYTNHHFECYTASARIRCEAAYITFK